MHGKLFQIPGRFFYGRFYTVGQRVSKPFPLYDHVNQFDDRVFIAPGQFQSVSGLRVNQVVFKAFDGIGHGSTRGNGVDTCPVAHLVDFNNRIKIFIEHHGAESSDGFVFGFVAFQSLIGSGWDVDLAAAGKRTGLAGIPFLLTLDYRLTRQFFNALERKVRGQVSLPSS